ncbi:MAG: hypothetical protein KBG48_19235 [Kofleriaceae bacterium]|nr:hypothetical protein [Kofleriaceae bacterium]MBP9169543.1 hypothetical protein [Kofleriaceae bacterium]MBP9859188.1 hypothetical protein [Kofleriaceae bacterium]
MNTRGVAVDAAGPAEERAAAARAILVEATAAELARAVAAVTALVGGPHCAIDGRGPDEWVLIAVAELLAEGRRLPLGLPLWVALRDRAVERIIAARAAREAAAGRSATGGAATGDAATEAAMYGALERRVIARMVPQRLDARGVAVLRALCDGVTRTEQLAAAVGASVAEVLATRRTIAATAQAVATELRGAPRRG